MPRTTTTQLRRWQGPGEEESDELNNATGQKTPPPRAASTVFFTLDDNGDVLAARPTPLAEVRPQQGVLRHIETFVPVQVLDTPVPQLGNRWWKSCRRSTRRCFPSRLSPCPRSLWIRGALRVVVRGGLNSWRKCLRSYPILLCMGLWSRTHDIPVPHGRRDRGGGGGLQGLRRGQNSTALCGAVRVGIPVPHGRGGRVGHGGL